MGYKLDDKAVKITEKQLTRLGSGNSGHTYKFQNVALKIFDNPEKSPEALETAKYLKNISTDRILLPKQILYYNNEYKGFARKLLPNKGLGKRIITEPKEDFIRDVELIENDNRILSKKGILLDGICPNNTHFDGNLYLTDPTKYSHLFDLFSTYELERLNKYQLHLLFTELIVSDLRKNGFNNNQIAAVKELLCTRDESENSSEFFEEVFKQDDTIKQFVKNKYYFYK